VSSSLLASIHVYPVKSLGGVDVQEAHVEPWGLRDDRRWLVLNPDGTVLTAREQHPMVGVTAEPMGDGAISLTGLDGSTLRVEAPLNGELVGTSLARLDSVRLAAAEAADWLSHQLQQPARLGWLDDPRRRTVSTAHGGLPGDHLNLSDAGPLLLTTRASLRQLNQWIARTASENDEEPPAPIVMAHFRPSVVVAGPDEPFAEDDWKHVRIGAVEFRFAEHCDRCVLTTIDPQTGCAGKEPLRTLARHRRWDDKTWFGIRMIPSTTGVIRAGDSLAL
jgi:uncharacterized protein YcbX